MKHTVHKFGGRTVVAIWASVMSVVVASLMVSHWVVLPHPDEGTTLQADLTEVSLGTMDQPWLALHVLYGDCPCSRRVLRHVLQREPLPGVTERIVLIGRDDEMELKARQLGFQSDVVTPEQLQQRYGLESAPLLVVVDRSGTIHYSGGYTSRKQGYQIEDVARIENVMHGMQQTSLPVYGCAVSERLDQLVDPLGLKN